MPDRPLSAFAETGRWPGRAQGRVAPHADLPAPVPPLGRQGTQW